MENTIAVRVFIFNLLLFSLPPVTVSGEEVGLNDYLREVRAKHPYFTGESYNIKVERAEQNRLQGDEDWVLKSALSYQHGERSTGNIFVAEEEDNLLFTAGAERTFWSSGGRLSIDYDFTSADLRFSPPTGSIDEYGNEVTITYAMPLMQNKGGELSRLDYDLKGYDIDLSGVNSAERGEAFLERQGQLFLDWVLVDEERRIAERRLDLANVELERTERKLKSHLVAEVDMLGARDAVINARQNLSLIQSRWRGLQAELATQSGDEPPYRKSPSFDLYTFNEVPSGQGGLDPLIQKVRQLKAIDLRLAQLDRLKRGLGNRLDPELDLVIGGGLNSESDELGGSYSMDKPAYMVGVNFRYPLGSRNTRGDLDKADLRYLQLQEVRRSTGLQIEAQLRKVLVQLKELKGVIDLNREQVEVARLRTAEELKRHDQGRSELSFVIQSRDNEQRARLAYANNAANHHKLWLRYMALTDLLLEAVDREGRVSK